jgi:hypothetical protein
LAKTVFDDNYIVKVEVTNPLEWEPIRFFFLYGFYILNLL